jgi:hypothetical protein
VTVPEVDATTQVVVTGDAVDAVLAYVAVTVFPT